MEAVIAIAAAVSALAAAAAVWFAWLTAKAERDAAESSADAVGAAQATVREARAARYDEQQRAQMAALERVASLIGEVQDAWMTSMSMPGDARGMIAVNRGQLARGRLAVAIAATGLELPACQHVATLPGTPTAEPYVAAFTEISAAMAAAQPPAA